MRVAKSRVPRTLKSPLLAVASSLLFAVALAPDAAANLIQDGTFTGVSLKAGYTGPALTTLFGQFGDNSSTTTGSVLTVANWNTNGYNFVYAPGTADSGTGANGANTGQPNQAPGQYNVGSGVHAGYGSTYMSGINNDGTKAITAVPGGGNFIAADGAFQVGAVTQTVTGLQIGKTYALSFYYAAAQQEGTGFNQATTENWKVTFTNQTLNVGVQPLNQTTTTINLPAKSFSGWFQQIYNFVATDTSGTLSFLAAGTPTGQPPFSLLGNVSLDIVPEFSNWMVFAGFGAVVTAFEVFRRRRQLSAASAMMG